MGYLVATATVFGVNLLPALGPPTWAVLVLFHLHQHLDAPALVGLGAVAAGGGRSCLALGTRALRSRLPRRRVASLQALGAHISAHRGRTAAALGLFLVSPLPSAQLFEAAGILGVRLVPVTAVFVAGRLVSYSLYIGAASLAEASFGGALRDSLTSWPSIAVQSGLILGLLLLARVDWAARLGNGSGSAVSAQARR